MKKGTNILKSVTEWRPKNILNDYLFSYILAY